MSGDLLFVYGSLRRNADAPMQSRLAEAAEWLSPAHFQGKLYRISWYPGVVQSDDPRDRVVGDVYRLFNPALSLPLFDEYEDYLPEAPGRSLYLRRQRPVALADGGARQAWIYLYNRPVEGLEFIPTGDYLERQGGGSS